MIGKIAELSPLLASYNMFKNWNQIDEHLHNAHLIDPVQWQAEKEK